MPERADALPRRFLEFVAADGLDRRDGRTRFLAGLLRLAGFVRLANLVRQAGLVRVVRMVRLSVRLLFVPVGGAWSRTCFRRLGRCFVLALVIDLI